MKPGSITTVVFALGCAAIAWQSAQILGTGFWGWAILATGVFIAAGPYYRRIRGLARVIALVLSIIAFLAVALGLLAATIGGSFNLPDDQALLLLTFGIVGILGVVVFITMKQDKIAG